MPCVQAFELFAKGSLSLSPCVSSFLMNLNNINVAIIHIGGESIPLTDKTLSVVLKIHSKFTTL